jgi:hypothetical protein
MLMQGVIVEGRRRRGIEKGTGGGDELGVAGGGLALLEPLVVGQLIRLHALGAVPAAGQEGRMGMQGQLPGWLETRHAVLSWDTGCRASNRNAGLTHDQTGMVREWHISTWVYVVMPER